MDTVTAERRATWCR